MQSSQQWLIIFTVVILLSSCSHNTAYIRPGIPSEVQPEPAPDAVASRLILVGDAGEPVEPPQESVLLSLATRAGELEERTTIIFLGDNIYPAGLPPKEAPDRSEMAAKLLPQIEAVKKSGAQGIFVPGNHDWNHSKPGGKAAVQRQQDFVTARLGDKAFFPQNGCPGPVKIDAAGVRLLLIDTEWWLHRHDKGTSDCFPEAPQTVEAAKERFIEGLIALVETAGDRQVIIAGHHPLATHGPHGGFFDWKDHIFPLTQLKPWLWVPLPVVGSLYPLTRWYLIKSDQDLVGSANKELVRRLNEAFSHAAKPVIYAAGHDHALQVLQGSGQVGYVLVSGAGAEEKSTKVGHGDDTYFAHVQPGFMEIDMLKNGSVFLRVFEQKKDRSGFRLAFSYWLFQ